MTRFLPLVLVVAASCGSPVILLPDGGRPRQICSSHSSLVGVKTIDLTGQPVSGAQVVATNSATHGQLVGLTDGAGVSTAVNQDIGTGYVELKATAGALASKSFYIDVTCGECDCIAQPDNVTLTLQ